MPDHSIFPAQMANEGHDLSLSDDRGLALHVEDGIRRPGRIRAVFQKAVDNARDRSRSPEESPAMIVWADRRNPWMTSPSSARMQMEKMIAQNINTRKSRGWRRLLHPSPKEFRSRIVIVYPHENIYLPAPPAADRGSISDFLRGLVRARRSSHINNRSAEAISNDLFNARICNDTRVPTLPIIDGLPIHSTAPSLYRAGNTVSPSERRSNGLIAQNRLNATSTEHILTSHRLRTRPSNVLANQRFGAPQRGNRAPSYNDDRSPPKYSETALPGSPLYRLHDGTLFDIHDQVLRADGLIRYHGDDPNRIPRLGIRGRLYLELNQDILAREGLPVETILEQHIGEGLRLRP